MGAPGSAVEAPVRQVAPAIQPSLDTIAAVRTLNTRLIGSCSTQPIGACILSDRRSPENRQRQGAGRQQFSFSISLSHFKFSFNFAGIRGGKRVARDPVDLRAYVNRHIRF
jgi:hypothetical protein